MERTMDKDAAEACVDVWSKLSRFQTLTLVLDSSKIDESEVNSVIKSLDAKGALKLAKGLKSKYCVVSGQLMRKKAGVFSVFIMSDDEPQLHMAVDAAIDKLESIGETNSLWIVMMDEPRKSNLMAFLAQQSATAGHA